jgi:hypothetical protein
MMKRSLLSLKWLLALGALVAASTVSVAAPGTDASGVQTLQD